MSKETEQMKKVGKRKWERDDTYEQENTKKGKRRTRVR
jgi:hypothetical protein